MATNFSRLGGPGRSDKQSLSSHNGSDLHYRTGDRNPPMQSDPGAGPWNSKPKTATAIAQHAGLLALAIDGYSNIYPGINATRHLRHYLLNTGLPYTIDLEDMVKSVPSAQVGLMLEFRQAQRFLRTLPVGRHRFSSIFGENGYNAQAENAEWFFAIGGYTRWGKGEAIITADKAGRHYDVDFEYCVYDSYNWDGGKEVIILGRTISDEFMGEFHLQGLAREFECRGSIHRKLVWHGDAGGPDRSVVLKGQGR